MKSNLIRRFLNTATDAFLMIDGFHESNEFGLNFADDELEIIDPKTAELYGLLKSEMHIHNQIVSLLKKIESEERIETKIKSIRNRKG